MGLEYDDLRHRYGERDVLRGVSFAAPAGEVTCLLGPSGSGKSTLLRLAAGLERVQGGAIRLDGAVLCDSRRQPPPERRPVGLVFQDNVLFPHMTARENVAFGLRHLPAQSRQETAARQLASVGLASMGERFPDTLSGGEQQRVALARALAPAPKVMLLDEPFANVDATLRRALREDARRALRDAGSVALVVTHDPEEALELGDRIVVLGDGRVLQAGAPSEIWQRPAEARVAAMFGQAQRLGGRAKAGVVHTSFGRFDWPELGADGEMDVVVRPTAVALAPVESGVQVEDIRFLGERYVVILRKGDDVLRASLGELRGLAVGGHVAVSFDRAGTFVYRAEDASARG